MFSNSDIEYLRQLPLRIKQLNNHDVTLHSDLTGHEWVIISRYDGSSCHILHRHSPRYAYHRQRENCRSLRDALDYITVHEEWFVETSYDGLLHLGLRANAAAPFTALLWICRREEVNVKLHTFISANFSDIL